MNTMTTKRDFQTYLDGVLDHYYPGYRIRRNCAENARIRTIKPNADHPLIRRIIPGAFAFDIPPLDPVIGGVIFTQRIPREPA